jgi:hypothetical protein
MDSGAHALLRNFVPWVFDPFFAENVSLARFPGARTQKWSTGLFSNASLVKTDKSELGFTRERVRKGLMGSLRTRFPDKIKHGF